MLYTSDGRDVEMSVASTKAFYAQVAAGVLLACAIAEAAGVGTDRRPSRAARRRCASCPTAMRTVLAGRDGDRRGRPALRARRSATGRSSATAPTRSPPKRCGSSSPSSATSRSPATSPRTRSTSTCRREPLILVCAAGLSGATADDVAKEVAIYRAHKATPIVIATEGDERFAAASAVIARAGGRTRRWRSCSRRWSATCSATRRRWPSTRSARPLREAREADRARGRSARRSTATTCSPRCAPASARCARAVRRRAAQRARTTATSRRAPRCASAALLRDAAGDSPLEALPGRVRQGRHAERAGRRPHRGADRGRSRSSPGRSTPSSTRPRRSPSASPAATRACSTGRSCRRCSAAGAGRDRAQLPHAARCSPTSTRRSPTVVGFTRYRIDGDPPAARRSASSTAAACRCEVAEPGRAQPAAARHQAPRRRRARGARGPGPQRRAHA